MLKKATHSDLNALTATEISGLVREGRTSAEAVVRACLERVAEREDEVRAWCHIDPEQAIAAAQALDRKGISGPLAGVPFAVKDIIDTADMPTEWGSTIHKGRRPGRDAACVALSKKAGGLLLGKSVTTAFANQSPGPTRNPHDLQRTPGGSSSGSAAAVADLMVPLAIGTQTTGSTVRPASFCGIYGFRPTYADDRLHGVMEASGSLDTLGILARSLEDVALYRDVLLGLPPEPIRDDLAAPRIAFCRTPMWDQVEPETQALVEGAIDRLARAGARARQLDLPADFEDLVQAHRWISGFEFARSLTYEIENHWEDIPEAIRNGRIADGLACSYAKYIDSKLFSAQRRRRMDDLWEDHDVIVTAGAVSEAPVGWDPFKGGPLYKMWSILHLPAITLPVLTGPNGLPIGLQVLAPRHKDRELFAHSRWILKRVT